MAVNALIPVADSSILLSSRRAAFAIIAFASTLVKARARDCALLSRCQAQAPPRLGWIAPGPEEVIVRAMHLVKRALPMIHVG